ncbi:MAG: DUF1223 domain-containing protein [Betaproteobacteria bacterium]
MRVFPFLAAAALSCALSFPAAGAQCSAQSGERTAVLVELYTSEGCDSCPPADRWLSSLQSQGYTPDRVVPLALHVDYWDYIGWKDPYAKREFATRQRRQAELKRARIVYTPQVLLQGQDFRRWGSGEFAAAVEKMNAQAPRAKVSLTLMAMGRTSVDVAVSAELLATAERKDAALYLAAFENKLTSQVAAGENKGKTLPHDFVVREWIGPLAFDADLRVADKRTLPLLPNANPRQSGVAAFVQNRATGDVLQALMLPACAG